MTQDNILLRQMVEEMIGFIVETGALNFSTENRTQKAMIKGYFKNVALSKITQNGFDMGINTPWGVDVSGLDEVNTFNPLQDYDEDYGESEEDDDEQE